MKISFTILLIFSLIILAYANDEQLENEDRYRTQQSSLVYLTDDTIQSINKGVWFVEFFAPWCGHCQKLAPTWRELSQSKGRIYSQVNIASVNCEESNGACRAQDVQGFPTIKLFVDGEMKSEYAGERTTDDFIEFLNKNLN